MAAAETRNPIDATREIAEHAARIARLELELKATEFRGKAVGYGIGAGLGLLAILLAPLLVVFALAVVAAALATSMSAWLAILIVTALLFVLVGGLATAAFVIVKRVAR